MSLLVIMGRLLLLPIFSNNYKIEKGAVGDNTIIRAEVTAM